MSIPALAASAVPEAASAATAEISLSGTLLVATVDATATKGEAGSSIFALRTPAGSIVSLAGELPADAKTGDAFAGTVAVPAAVLDGLTAKQAKAITSAAAPMAADSAESIAAQAEASDLNVPLAVAEAEVTPSVSAATVASHTLYLALPIIGGKSVSESFARAIVISVADYWKSQSEGVMPSFTIALVAGYTSGYACNSNPIDRWLEAAQYAGDPSADMFFNYTGKHLVVLLPQACYDGGAFLSVSTIGDDVHLGGISEVVIGVAVDRPLVAKQIGHNLGLDDADLEYCGSNAGYVGCDNYAEGDDYDVMGDGSYYSNGTLTALNGASKVGLGFVGGANAPVVQLPAGQTSATVDVALPSLSNVTGVQVIQIVDPNTSEVRYVEYRSGTGIDAGAVYTQYPDVLPGSYRLRAGVRLLERDGSLGTEALTRWVASTGAAEAALPIGASIATGDGAVKVTYLSGTAPAPAQVRIELTRGTAPAGVPVYRFWSAKNQTHFYTISAAEKKAVEDNYSDDVWKYESVAYLAFTTQAPGTVPVYRFWSEQFQGHFYTTSSKERDVVRDLYDESIWKYENIAYFVYPTSATNQELNSVYRFWSDKNKHHFYTASAAERDLVINQYSDDVWKYELEVFKVPTR